MGGPGTNWGARRAKQFPHFGKYTLTPAFKCHFLVSASSHFQLNIMLFPPLGYSFIVAC